MEFFTFPLRTDPDLFGHNSGLGANVGVDPKDHPAERPCNKTLKRQLKSTTETQRHGESRNIETQVQGRRFTRLVSLFKSQNHELSRVFPSLCLCGSTAEFRLSRSRTAGRAIGAPRLPAPRRWLPATTAVNSRKSHAKPPLKQESEIRKQESEYFTQSRKAAKTREEKKQSGFPAPHPRS